MFHRTLPKIRLISFSFLDVSYRAWFGITICLIQTILAGIFYFLSLYFVHYLNFNIETAGLLISFYGVGAVAGGLFGGRLSDKFAAKPVAIFCLIIQGLTFLLLSNISQFYHVLLATFLLGSSNYGFITSNTLWVLSRCDRSSKENLRVINILAVVSNLGLSISALIASFVAISNFTQLFLFNGFVLLLIATLLFLPFELSNNFNIINTNKEQNSTKRCGRYAIDKKLLLWTYVSLLLIGIVISQMSTTYSIFVKSIIPNYGVSAFSFLFALNTILVVSFQGPIGEYLNGKNAMLAMGCGALLMSTGLLVLANAFNYYSLILSCFIYTFGEMIYFSIAQLVCYERSNESEKGTQLGIFRAIYAFSRIIGPIVGGAIFFHFGGRIVWYFCFCLSIAAFIFCYYFRKYVTTLT